MSFNGITAVITGASSGIGHEMAKQLAAQGARVGLLARRVDRLQKLQSQLAASGAQSSAVACDVVNPKAVSAAIAELEQKLGPTDLLIANAGVSIPMTAYRFDASKVAHTFDVNVMGVVHTIEAVLPGMLERKRGHIVGISSLAAYVSMPTSAAYCASKSALSSFLESLRLELRSSGVDVSVICPGFIKSEMTDSVRAPMPFLLDTEPAVRRMLRAIEARKASYAFPKRLYWVIRASKFLPDRVFAGFGKDPDRKRDKLVSPTK